MSSNYNTRGRAAELLVDGSQARLVRARESIDDQLRLEQASSTAPATEAITTEECTDSRHTFFGRFI